MKKSTKIALGFGAGAVACTALAVHFWGRKKTGGAMACGIVGGCAAAAGCAVCALRKRDTSKLEYREKPLLTKLGGSADEQESFGHDNIDSSRLQIGQKVEDAEYVGEMKPAPVAETTPSTGNQGTKEVIVPILNGTPEQFVETQRALAGMPYVWGGKNPDTEGGLDCSGAVLYGVNQLGNNIPVHDANSIYHNLTVPVERDDMKPGDLRFMSDNKGRFYHVQVIVDEDGSRVNATGTDTNTRENPGIIELLPGPLPQSGEIRRLQFKE